MYIFSCYILTFICLVKIFNLCIVKDLRRWKYILNFWYLNCFETGYNVISSRPIWNALNNLFVFPSIWQPCPYKHLATDLYSERIGEKRRRSTPYRNNTQQQNGCCCCCCCCGVLHFLETISLNFWWTTGTQFNCPTMFTPPPPLR